MRIASINSLSMTWISFENRFVMRPSGVVSKKAIGARSTRVIAFCSIVLLAFVPQVVRIVAYAYIRTACEPPSPA